MGKSTEPPTCRFCGKPHRGTCMDHEAKGAISSQRRVGTIAHIDHRKTSLTAAITKVLVANPGALGVGAFPSGGSSAVERRPSKPTVEGSTPSPRSKPTRGEKALSPASKGSRPRSAKAKAGSSVSSPPKSKRVSTTITDKVNGISHTSVHVPIPAAELANLYAGAIPKKRKPRMTHPTDKHANSDPMNGPVTKPARGRPKKVGDRKAYLAQKAKERRAKLKAAK